MIDKDTPDRIYATMHQRSWRKTRDFDKHTTNIEYIKASKVQTLVDALELAPEPVANPSYEYIEDWNMWFTAAMKALNEYKGTK